MKDARVNITKSFLETIDMALWFEDITEDSDSTHITTAIARVISNLSDEGCTDLKLLEAFQEYFEGWSKETFDKATMEGKRILKQLLREGGVYTGRKKWRDSSTNGRTIIC